MTYHAWAAELMPSIELDLREALHTPALLAYPELVEQLEYHMGWNGSGSAGKRVRPMMVLLTCVACGGDWRKALPAASAIELVHNFSLIHDDIEDHSDIRHGRQTIWAKWGEAQAINAGDAMFSAALSSMLRLNTIGEQREPLTSLRVLLDACVSLMGGQQLDIAFETAAEISIEEYIKMVSGKTASLMQASTTIGAITAGAADQVVQKCAEFGYSLGFAFQMVDDWLGIWGSPATTGKSAATDIVQRKKTLPILFGLQAKKGFHDLWNSGLSSETDIGEMTRLLVVEGARDFTEKQAALWTRRAVAAIHEAIPQGSSAGDALVELAKTLLQRQK